jgi:uracil-DNA glycosylase
MAEEPTVQLSQIQWPPVLDALEPGWRDAVQAFLETREGQALSRRLEAAIATGLRVYPYQPLRALSLTPPAEVRAVILGQDPYHGPGQAEGLAFSVAPGRPIPPSLRNIFKELKRSSGVPLPEHGSLLSWARQGILLLNTCLTVEEGRAGSHAQWGWELLTDTLVEIVADQPRPVVFMLWGAHAQQKRCLIEHSRCHARHLILEANHPSPLSASRGPRPFLGCDHFRLAEAFWAEAGWPPMRW